jgi:hypothetical protein
MALQAGVTTDVAYKAETTWGSDPGVATGAKYLRRVSSGITLSKDSYSSNEVRRDLQVADLRHGVRRVQGPLAAEVCLTDHDDLYEAGQGGTWTAGVTASQVQLTNVAGNSGTKTLTFGGGSLITQGFKVGDVVRFTGAANLLNANFRITAITATTMVVAEAFVTFAAVTTFTVFVVGSKLINGVVKRSFTFEHRFEDIVQYQRFNGCRVNGISLSLPPTGISTVSFDIMGKDATAMSGTPFYTSPTAAGTSGVMAAINGALSVSGTDVAVVTGLDMNIARNMSGDPVVGANTIPEMFMGRIIATGTLTAFLQDATLWNAFNNETVMELAVLLTSPTVSGAYDFISVHAHAVKFTGADLPVQGEAGLPISIPFQCLLKAGGAATVYDQTSITIQRSN